MVILNVMDVGQTPQYNWVSAQHAMMGISLLSQIQLRYVILVILHTQEICHVHLASHLGVDLKNALHVIMATNS